MGDKDNQSGERELESSFNLTLPSRDKGEKRILGGKWCRDRGLEVKDSVEIKV